MVSSCLQGAMTLGFTTWCRPSSVPTCILPRATQHELQSDLHMDATCDGLRGFQTKPGCDLSWLQLVPDLEPLSKMYGAWELAEAGFCLFERI